MWSSEPSLPEGANSILFSHFGTQCSKCSRSCCGQRHASACGRGAFANRYCVGPSRGRVSRFLVTRVVVLKPLTPALSAPTVRAHTCRHGNAGSVRRAVQILVDHVQYQSVQLRCAWDGRPRHIIPANGTFHALVVTPVLLQNRFTVAWRISLRRMATRHRPEGLSGPR